MQQNAACHIPLRRSRRNFIDKLLPFDKRRIISFILDAYCCCFLCQTFSLNIQISPILFSFRNWNLRLSGLKKWLTEKRRNFSCLRQFISFDRSSSLFFIWSPSKTKICRTWAWLFLGDTPKVNAHIFSPSLSDDCWYSLHHHQLVHVSLSDGRIFLVANGGVGVAISKRRLV